MLQAYIKTSPLLLIRFKTQAIVMSASGASPETIAEGLTKKPSTI